MIIEDIKVSSYIDLAKHKEWVSPSEIIEQTTCSIILNNPKMEIALSSDDIRKIIVSFIEAGLLGASSDIQYIEETIKE